MQGKDNEIISQLENKFRHLTKILYDTDVAPKTLTREVMPYLNKDVFFKDPWQQGGGIDRYTLGMKGFHCMLYFKFDIDQLHVQLNQQKGPGGVREGRVIIDGIMHLRQLSWLFTYPLRTILVYKFRLLPGKPSGDCPPFEIYFHEEMWSFGDMIQNIPLVKLPYDMFRSMFASGFLAASRASLWFQNKRRGSEWQ
eukprot:TRINITY_DN6852_c0_g1_i1.p1 TRINITY_DN6852_c0_g1~~TRINITY_DN6852_c0_g1_i1.p1  ORF type:complete len:196 (+),score=48.36 TRINITY_DN6852_c0_g1_i1:111-698(+)